jgi:hypothetical protein
VFNHRVSAPCPEVRRFLSIIASPIDESRGAVLLTRPGGAQADPDAKEEKNNRRKHKDRHA